MLNPTLVNPYDIPPHLDLPIKPVDEENWTEHWVFFAYDPDEQFGFFLHVGRLIEAPHIWRSVLQIYLPGEELLVAKTYGEGNDRGPGAGPMLAQTIDPFQMWTFSFDGPAFSTDRKTNTHKIHQDGRAELIKIFTLFEAAGPIHSLQAGRELTDGMSVASYHTSQIVSMRGEVEFRGKKLAIKGVGVRDHSCGPRDYGPVYGDNWSHALFPSGLAVHVQEVSFENHIYQSGYVYWGDGSPMEEIEVLDMQHCCNPDTPAGSIEADPLAGPDARYFATIRTSRGDLQLEGELLHSHAITYFKVMEEFIGTALGETGGIQMCDCPMRVTCNGEVGYGLRERASRTEALKASHYD
jgi:hypothetical protein